MNASIISIDFTEEFEAEVRGAVALWLTDVADGEDVSVVRRGAVASWEGSDLALAVALERFDACCWSYSIV